MLVKHSKLGNEARFGNWVQSHRRYQSMGWLKEKKKKVNKHMRKLIPSAYYHIKQRGKYATNYCWHANIR